MACAGSAWLSAEVPIIIIPKQVKKQEMDTQKFLPFPHPPNQSINSTMDFFLRPLHSPYPQPRVCNIGELLFLNSQDAVLKHCSISSPPECTQESCFPCLPS